MSRSFHWSVAIASVAVALVLPGRVDAEFIVRSIGGSSDPASIQDVVDEFRADIGGDNNLNAPGPLAGGRREINWDGGGNNSTIANAPTPFAGFLGIRGALFTTPGTGFSRNPEFADVNPTYPDTFGTFSPLRLFSPLGSNITDVFFFVPGNPNRATVSAFGAVFTDVDLATSTLLEFFSISGSLLFSQAVEVGTESSESLSFLGATANAGEAIFRVRITSGNAPLGVDDDPSGGADIVALDDFIYAEPLSVPEPSGLMLCGIGAPVVLASAARRQRRGNAA